MSKPQKYFVTVTYRNYLAPKNGYWENNTGLQTCNGFITLHPVEWLAKRYELQRNSWNEERDHTKFETVLFYAPLDDGINTEYLQDLT